MLQRFPDLLNHEVAADSDGRDPEELPAEGEVLLAGAAADKAEGSAKAAPPLAPHHHSTNGGRHINEYVAYSHVWTGISTLFAVCINLSPSIIYKDNLFLTLATPERLLDGNVRCGN